MRWRQAVAVLLILLAAAEIIRSLGRLDGVIFTGYTQVGEVVLQGGGVGGGTPTGFASTPGRPSSSLSPRASHSSRARH